MKRSIAEKLEVSISKRSSLKIVFVLLSFSCTYDDIPLKIDCTKSTLEISSIKTTGESACLMENGMAEVSVIGGDPPYLYSINGQPMQTKNSFTQLSSGSHNLLVKDAIGCLDTATFKIANFTSKLAASIFTTADNVCIDGNGSVKVRPLNGLPPFTFSLDSKAPSKDSIFSTLNHGQYSMTVVDALQCEYTVSFTIPRANTGVSWSGNVKTIIATACSKSGCHVSGTGRADLTTFEKVKQYASEIRSRVINRSMPFDGRLSDDQIQLIACWVEDGALEN